MNPVNSPAGTLGPSAPVPVGQAEKRRYRSKLERRRIAEETFVPGASVALVARAHEVNASQVRSWRKLYQQGLLDDGTDAAALLPVRLCEKIPQAPARRPGEPCGAIEIEAGQARVRIAGSADPTTLRILLEHLLG